MTRTGRTLSLATVTPATDELLQLPIVPEDRRDARVQPSPKNTVPLRNEKLFSIAGRAAPHGPGSVCRSSFTM